MKTFIATLALAASTSVAAYDYRTHEELNVADLPPAPAPVEQKEPDLCEASYETAKIIMEKRQEGVSLAKMYGLVKDSEELLRKMVLAAYEMPKYSTYKMQQSAVREFSDEVYLTCIKATS